jgi:hypothetical protein
MLHATPCASFHKTIYFRIFTGAYKKYVLNSGHTAFWRRHKGSLTRLTGQAKARNPIVKDSAAGLLESDKCWPQKNYHSDLFSTQPMTNVAQLLKSILRLYLGTLPWQKPRGGLNSVHCIIVSPRRPLKKNNAPADVGVIARQTYYFFKYTRLHFNVFATQPIFKFINIL